MNINKPILPFPCSDRFYDFIMRNKRKIMFDDTMIVGILWGNVGCGKSVRAQQFAYIVNGENGTTEDMISFSKDEFVKSILTHSKKCIIPDEGIAIFFSRGAMTKEGRLMAEIMGQCRQKNLMLIICIPDILSVDSFVLNMANFVGYVWETRKLIGTQITTMKGNLRLYPNFRNDSYKNRIIQFLKIRKSNPLIKAKQPKPWLTEAGQAYGEGHKPAFYAIDEAIYKAKKESILKKYQTKIEKKIPKKVDYETLDKLLKAHISQKEIQAMMGISMGSIKARARFMKPLKPRNRAR